MTKNKFEDKMSELEKIVNKLETGDVSLDESIDLFEQGLQLSRELNDQLNSYEKRIDELLNSNLDNQSEEV